MRIKSQGVVTNIIYPSVYQDIRTSDNRVLSTLNRNLSAVTGGTNTITYDDTKRSGPVKKTRYCRHVKYAVARVRPTTVEAWADTSKSRFSRWSNHPFVFRDLGLPSIPSLGSVHSEAYDFFKSGGVDQEIDLSANLYEIKQVTGLFGQLKTSLQRLKGRKVDLAVADTYLAYSFGIKPLISDALAVYKAITDVSLKLAWLRKNQGKPVKLTFRKDLSKSNRPADILNSGGGIVRNNRVVINYECRYMAYCVAKYDVSQLTDLELKLRYFARTFGVDNPLGTAWELMPWSFVIDWFLRVGDWISALAPKISLPVQFVDLGWSIKIRQDCDSYFTAPYGFKSGKISDSGPESYVVYERHPGLPVSFGSIVQGDPLGSQQLALGLALAIQKFAR